MKVRALVLILAAWLGGHCAASAQLPEGGEWRMFGAPLTRSSHVSTRAGDDHRVAPVWLYNTRTGTIYRVTGRRDRASAPCEQFASVFRDRAPCIDESLVPVPVIVRGDEEITFIEREPEPGDWRMYAREATVEDVDDQIWSYGIWLYNAFTGSVYEVMTDCYIGVDSAVGCMFRVPIRDTYNRPASLNPVASGILQ